MAIELPDPDDNEDQWPVSGNEMPRGKWSIPGLNEKNQSDSDQDQATKQRTIARASGHESNLL
jgi:hypothetical protein